MSRGGVKELKVLIASERTSTLENDENLATMNKKGDSGLNVSSHGSQAAISSIGKCRQIESSVLKHMKELQDSFCKDKSRLNSLAEKLLLQKEALETQQSLLKRQEHFKEQLVLQLKQATAKIRDLQSTSSNVNNDISSLKTKLQAAIKKSEVKDTLNAEQQKTIKALERKLQEKQSVVVKLTNKSYADEDQIKTLKAKIEITREDSNQVSSVSLEYKKKLSEMNELVKQLKNKISVKEVECTNWNKKANELQLDFEKLKKEFANKENTIISGFNVKLNSKKSEIQSLQTRIGKVMANYEKDMRQMKSKFTHLNDIEKSQAAVAAENTKLKSEVNRLEMQIQNMNEHQEQAKKEMENSEKLHALDREKHLHHMRDKQSIETTLREEISGLQDAMKLEKTKYNVDLEAKMKQLKEQEEKNATLSNQIAQVEEERDKAIMDSKRLTSMRGAVESRFNELAEQCQRLMGERDALKSENEKLLSKTSQDMMNIEKREKELKAAVSKLSAAEQAVEGEMTCMECLQIFDNPCLLPTGETYCEKCVNAIRKERQVEYTLPNKQIATLAGKFVFMKQSIAAIKEMQQANENMG